MATVLTLEPAFIPCMQLGWLRSTVTFGNTVIAVPYVNIPDPFGIDAAAGMTSLDQLLRARIDDAGGVTVFGHSMGAQVACKWLRERGPTSSVDPAKVRFVLTGNPERRYGGVLGMLSGPGKPVVQNPGWVGGVQSPPPNSVAVNVKAGQKPGVPDNNRYQVLDIARQYDFFADYPTAADPGQPAKQNASTAIHCDYFRNATFDAGTLTFGPENNVTYYLLRTKPMASVARAWWLNTADKAAKEATDRAAVEADYQRPMTTS